jgi:hypothetical protein
MINEKAPAAKKLSFGTAFLKEQRQKEHLGVSKTIRQKS